MMIGRDLKEFSLERTIPNDFYTIPVSCIEQSMKILIAVALTFATIPAWALEEDTSRLASAHSLKCLFVSATTAYWADGELKLKTS